MSVDLPNLRERDHYRVYPWIRMTADNESGEISLAAGMKLERLADDDGA